MSVNHKFCVYSPTTNEYYSYSGSRGGQITSTIDCVKNLVELEGTAKRWCKKANHVAAYRGLPGIFEVRKVTVSITFSK